MWKLLFASSLVLLTKTCLCEVRKTIKVEKYGAPYIPAHLRLEAGDQKEVTVCLKFRTFAYKDGFHCPFAIYTGLTISVPLPNIYFLTKWKSSKYFVALNCGLGGLLLFSEKITSIFESVVQTRLPISITIKINTRAALS